MKYANVLPPDRKQLLICRHAKSSWDDASLSDVERPLNKRGRRDAPEMGRRLAERNSRNRSRQGDASGLERAVTCSGSGSCGRSRSRFTRQSSVSSSGVPASSASRWKSRSFPRSRAMRSARCLSSGKNAAW